MIDYVCPIFYCWPQRDIICFPVSGICIHFYSCNMFQMTYTITLQKIKEIINVMLLSFFFITTGIELHPHSEPDYT